MIEKPTRERVRLRALNRCEYCRLSQDYSEFPLHIEHIVAIQHGGSDLASNLARACRRCNSLKGPNLACIDPLSLKLVRLFNPRRDDWSHHFRHCGAEIEGRTPAGRGTCRLLAMNDTRRVELRQWILDRGEGL